LVCERWLDSSDRPSAGGERPNLVVTVSLEALIAAGDGRRGTDRNGRVEWDHTGPVDPETVQMIACDASVRRVVLDARSEPVDIGRRTKVVPAGMRRAVGVRDRGCRFPGCDRPPGWTDAHHAIHWTRGGPTAVHNLVLLCRRHHRLIHWNRFSVVMERGQPVFRRADGSLLEAKVPPRSEVAAVA
jgi:hypothetical protein